MAYATPAAIQTPPCMTSTPVPTSNVVQPPTLKVGLDLIFVICMKTIRTMETSRTVGYE